MLEFNNNVPEICYLMQSYIENDATVDQNSIIEVLKSTESLHVIIHSFFNDFILRKEKQLALTERLRAMNLCLLLLEVYRSEKLDNDSTMIPLFNFFCNQYSSWIRSSSSFAYQKYCKLFRNLFRKAFFVCKNFVTAAFDILSSLDFPISTYCLLGLSSVYEVADVNIYSKIRFSLLEHLKKKIQSATACELDLERTDWFEIIHSISCLEWNGDGKNDGLGIILLKSLKKSPETCASTATTIVSNLSFLINMDDLINGGVIPICLRILKLDENFFKSCGIKLICGISRRVSKNVYFESVVKPLHDALHGRWPNVATITQPLDHQKFSILSTLYCLSNEKSNPLSIHQLSTLLQYIEKEKELTYSAIASEVVGKCLVSNHCENDVASEGVNSICGFCDILKSTFKSSNNATCKTALLLALFTFTKQFPQKVSNDVYTFVLELCKDIFKKTPAINIDGVLILAMLLRCSKFDPSFLNVLKTTKIIHNIINSKNYILSEAFIQHAQKYSEQACAVLRLESDRNIDSNSAKLGNILVIQKMISANLEIFSTLSHFKLFDCSLFSVDPVLEVNELGLFIVDKADFPVYCSHMTGCLLLANDFSVDLAVLNEFKMSFFCNPKTSFTVLMYLFEKIRGFEKIIVEPGDRVPCLKAYSHVIELCLTAVENFGDLNPTFMGVLYGVSFVLCCHPLIFSSFKTSLRFWRSLDIIMKRPDNYDLSFGSISKFIISNVLYSNEYLFEAATRAARIIATHSESNDEWISLLYTLIDNINATLTSIEVLQVEETSTLDDPLSSQPQSSTNAVSEQDFFHKVKNEKHFKQSNSESDMEKKTNASCSESHLEIRKLLRFITSFSTFPANASMVCVYKIAVRGNIFKLFSESQLTNHLYSCFVPLLKNCVEAPLKPYVWELVGAMRFARLASNEKAQSMYTNATMNGPLPEFIVKLMKTLQVFSGPYKLKENQVILPSTFFMLFPILSYVCCDYPEETVSSAFSILNSLWPKMRKWEQSLLECGYVDEEEEFRNCIPSALQLSLTTLGKFPRISFPIEEFIIQVGTDAAPLSSHELKPIFQEVGLLNLEAKVRLTAIKFVKSVSMRSEILNLDESMDCILWITCFDEDPQIRSVARQIWGKYDILSISIDALLKFLNSKHLNIQRAVANSIAAIIAAKCSDSVDGAESILKKLKDIYMEYRVTAGQDSNLSQPRGNRPKRNSDTKDIDDTTVALRTAIALVFAGLSHHALTVSNVFVERVSLNILQFVVEIGVLDRAVEVRTAMVQAGKDLLISYGSLFMEKCILLFEEILNRKKSPSENVIEFDNRYAATVVLLGTAGRHFRSMDSSLLKIFSILLESLKIPSESVQRAVSDCLYPISKLAKNTEHENKLIQELIDLLFNSVSYGERRGAAFGLAAVIKGLGILSLQKYDLILLLKDRCANGSVQFRQGALFAYECFSERLGILFEPYVVKFVDGLLGSFSHGSDHVRDAAKSATKIILSNLSSHGVKLVLTPIINILETEKSWKSRQESIRMLGMMTHCAPKEFGSSLSQIVPILVKAGSDHHPKIKEAAKAAMTEVSAVIRNPEIASISPIILEAIADPANKTKDALETLLICEFLHSIDSSSLALLVPILSRGLKDRNKDLKRKAAAITGNIISMVSENAQFSHNTLLPGLKEVLLDPTPDVRACGAKALGALYCRVSSSESSAREILSWLIETVKSASSPVERSGAAQGLAEICGVCSDGHKQDLIIQWVLSFRNIKDDSSAREGMMWFLTFLPYTLKESFAQRIDTVLPVILKGLSDNNDGVREVAMRAGKVTVSVLGMNHAVELAPAICSGLFQEDWRIRLDSLQLLGELMFLIGDTKIDSLNNGSGEEEDGCTPNNALKVITNIKAHIGIDKTVEVLSALYMTRADVVVQVRQSALMIWKTVVSNTPRTLLEIMPVLVQLIVDKLSSNIDDLQEMAGKTVGELVTKLGDKILPAIIEPLQKGLMSEQESRRLGSSVGLLQVLDACSRKQCEQHIETIIGAIRLALCDSSSQVIELAARSFMVLYKTVGTIAVNEIVPELLKTISFEGEQSQRALRGLREIVALKPRDMLEYLLPILTASPISMVAANALSAVVEVSGQFLHYQFHILIDCVIRDLSFLEGTVDDDFQNRFLAMKDLAKAITSSISTLSLSSFLTEIGKHVDHETNSKSRRWACWMLELFFQTCKADYDPYLQLLLKYLLGRIIDVDVSVLFAVRDGLSAMVSAVSAEALSTHFEFIKNCITSTASSARHSITTAKSCFTDEGEYILPLFTLPKSLDPLFAMFLSGLMNGGITTKEIAAEMIGEIAVLSTVEVLKPTLIKTIGPLIRVMGERSSSTVKSSILKTIITFMNRGSATLKPFAPQLQTVLIKSLCDPLREVRARGVSALGKLLEINPKVDPLLSELSTMCLQSDSKAIKHSILIAIYTILSKCGDKATTVVLDKVQTTIISQIYEEDENVRIGAAKSLNCVVNYVDDTKLNSLYRDLMENSSMDESNICGKCMALSAILHRIGSENQSERDEIFKFLKQCSSDECVAVKISVARSLLILLSVDYQQFSDINMKSEIKLCSQTLIHNFHEILSTFVISSQSSDLSSASISCIEQAAKNVYGASAQHMQSFFPALIHAVKGLDIRVKYGAERAMKILIESPVPQSSGSVLYQQYVTKADIDTQVFLRDYYKRRLSEMSLENTQDENETLF